jgi:hypothetical protein
MLHSAPDRRARGSFHSADLSHKLNVLIRYLSLTRGTLPSQKNITVSLCESAKHQGFQSKIIGRKGVARLLLARRRNCFCALLQCSMIT